MLNINTNYASAFASNAAKTASKGLESAMEKLSSGSRINYAKDDAAGQAISTRLSAEIQGLKWLLEMRPMPNHCLTLPKVHCRNK